MATNGVLINTMKGVRGPSCSPVGLKWDIPRITSTQCRHFHNYAVMVLNRPITQSEHFMKNFWNNATVRVTVDGGTLQWDRYLSNMHEEVQKSMKLPNLISGDFDSITKSILEKYKKKGCKIVHTPDQDHTDFTKALIELYKYCQERKTVLEHVVALAQTSGRLDQIMGNVQTLFLAEQKHLLSPNMRLYIMSDDSLSWLLTPGDHIIIIPEETRNHKRAWCSLVPIGETCSSIATTGLKWNLNRQPLKFGELVSTSNTFDGSDLVTVTCSHAVLWSMRIPGI